MFGASHYKFVSGKWDHIGYSTTEDIALPSNGDALKKGTWVDHKNGDDSRIVLASGHSIGFTTQDLTTDGQTSLQSFKDRMIGKMDLPISKGQAVTVRRPRPGAILEFEGLGTAIPGNLVCTSGTGALSSGTARRTPLSFLNGCIRKAQTGDFVQAILVEPNLTAETSGNLRIRIEIIQGYIA
jgi:hypothetical protein